MKLVSWMVCWRRCSRALPSGEREDHGKQVLKHRQSSTSLITCRCELPSLTWFKDFRFLSHTVVVCILSWNMWHMRVLFLYLCLYVSVNTRQHICLCSPCLCSICCMAQRQGGWLYFLARVTRGKSQFTISWHNNKRSGRVWASGQLVGVWLWNRNI